MVYHFGVLVIEATHRSGTSVTAKLAKKQGKLVFAIPHSIEDSHGVGTNKLIKQGAKIVTQTKDIINEFPFLKYKEIPKEQKQEKDEDIKIENKKAKKCNEKYKEIYELITDKPITVNEICKKLNKNISEINNILLMLELEENIKKVEGGYICILEEK